MLQIDICPFASDALEDAMRLAQTKALNSYTFSDCLNFLNYVWSDIYSQICCIDSGYYSKTVRITDKVTKLPKFVKNSIMVYAAQSPDDGSTRRIFRQSGPSDFSERDTYYISGTDLFCPNAAYTKVWLEYCPQPMQIFFTHHNRDPKIYPDGHDVERNADFNLYELHGYIHINNVDGTTLDCTEVDISSPSVTYGDIASVNTWHLVHKKNKATAGIKLNNGDIDITGDVLGQSDENGEWLLKFISCDFPYIFCSYQHNVSGEWKSGFFNRQMEWTDYNPFEFLGRNDNVEYISCRYNDKTGMGVIVRDHNDVEHKLFNIDQLPEKAGTVILVENPFEYKASDGTVHNFTKGYWYNRYATDFNYEKVLLAKPSNPDIGDTVNVNGVIEVYNGTEWKVNTVITKVAQSEDVYKVKELGWTPDTRLVYPAPEVYRYLVARLAEKFSALNESNIMGVQSELADARFAFQSFLKKDKSAWERMRNVNLPTMTDWL